jgi:hypothetical protein
MQEIGAWILAFMRDHWEFLLGFVGLFAGVGALLSYKAYGSRRSSKNWLRNMEQEGTSKWCKLSLSRKPETSYVEGWAKSEWGEAFTRLSIEFNHESGVAYHVRIYCVRVVTSHLTWRSALGWGDSEFWRDQQVHEGVTLMCNENNEWDMVEKAPDIVKVFGLPQPEEQAPDAE